jgi:hypothetical protein
MPTDVISQAGDHDFHVVSLTPSVTLVARVPDCEVEDVAGFYRGECCTIGN